VLGRIGPTAEVAVLALGTALEDSDLRVRRLAAEALGEIGSGAIVRTLQDADPDIRARAAWRLGEIGPKARERRPPSLGPSGTRRQWFVGAPPRR
jgi:HEAT repeat protein